MPALTSWARDRNHHCLFPQAALRSHPPWHTIAFFTLDFIQHVYRQTHTHTHTHTHTRPHMLTQHAATTTRFTNVLRPRNPGPTLGVINRAGGVEVERGRARVSVFPPEARRWTAELSLLAPSSSLWHRQITPHTQPQPPHHHLSSPLPVCPALNPP